MDAATVVYLLAMTLLGVDYGQTNHIQNDGRYREKNPVIQHTTAPVYFAVIGGITTGAYLNRRHKAGEMTLMLIANAQVWTVLNNRSIGVEVRF